MKEMNVNEMRTVGGGAVYKEKCPSCKKVISYRYTGFINLIGAKLAFRRHKTNCYLKKYS